MKLFLTPLFFFLFIAGGHARTIDQITRDVRVMGLDLAFTDNVEFTDHQILRLLNEAQEDAIAATLCIRKAYVFDTSSGTVYYSLPATFMQIDRVLSDDQRLEEKSPAKLDKASSEWETVTGEPINFFVNFSSRTRIGFYPYPVTNTTTTTVKVEYYSQAAVLTSTSTPFDAITEFVPFQTMLAYYAAARMLYTNNMAADGDRYMQRYLAYRAQFNDFCRARPGSFPGVNVAPSR